MKGAENCDFSFSGLKNAARLLLEKNPRLAVEGGARSDFCAEVQAAITESLVDRSARALDQTGIRTFTVSGGVSANQGVLDALKKMAVQRGCDFHCATGGWNTDNASMIAAVVARRVLDGQSSDWEADADPRWSVAR
jgi:N6-L-threonylcarbamoyladenine synthase